MSSKCQRLLGEVRKVKSSDLRSSVKYVLLSYGARTKRSSDILNGWVLKDNLYSQKTKNKFI